MKKKKSRKHYIYIDLCSSSSRCSKLDGIHEGIGFVVLRHLVGKRHLCLESLHGVTFALMWSAAVEYSKSKSPVGWDSTVQSVVAVSWYWRVGGRRVWIYIFDLNLLCVHLRIFRSVCITNTKENNKYKTNLTYFT